MPSARHPSPLQPLTALTPPVRCLLTRHPHRPRCASDLSMILLLCLPACLPACLPSHMCMRRACSYVLSACMLISVYVFCACMLVRVHVRALYACMLVGEYVYRTGILLMLLKYRSRKASTLSVACAVCTLLAPHPAAAACACFRQRQLQVLRVHPEVVGHVCHRHRVRPAA